MKQTLFVMSDQHLGGEPATPGRPGFEMCPAKNRARLCEFIRYTLEQRQSGAELHLVINGDLVDFLAERDFSPFTETDTEALHKFRNIVARTEEVWDSLASFVGAGARLTILLGNHDSELSFPSPRRFLMRRLGPGDVEFIYDNQAYAEGPVLIEHGNSYDPWNVIAHDQLREVRSALSRGDRPPRFDPPAGSRLVTSIMNPLKARYAFVDLLKPENAAVAPILAVFDASCLKSLPAFFALARRSMRVQFDTDGLPIDRANIGAATAEAVERERELIQLANEIGRGGDSANIGAGQVLGDLLDRLRRAKDAAVRKAAVDLLYRAIRAFVDAHCCGFDVNSETNQYIRPAKAAARRGFQAVIMGHTHLVKRVSLRINDAVYLNTGTWADLMRVPVLVLHGTEQEAKGRLDEFVGDLLADRLDRWRNQIATFARVDIESGALASADVYAFMETGEVKRIPDGPMPMLGP